MYWTADNKVHSWDGAIWSLDSSIPSISTNIDDKESKEGKETNNIVQIGPGQFEVYIVNIVLREELDNKARGNDDWTMTSSWIDA